MKKFLLALMLVSNMAFAATDTPTSTHTPTITPTFTLTPTFTPTPIAAFDPNWARDYIYPQDVFATDGVVLASAVTTPLPGAAAPWVAQSLSRTAFVLSTGSAKARFSYGVQGDFAKGVNAPNMNVWAYASTTATAVAITVTLNVTRNSMNNLLPAGQLVYPGTATSVTSALTGSGTAGKVIRFKLPLSSSARFQYGDHLSFDLQRTGGVTTDLNIYRIEVEYLKKPYWAR
jgi:hypothetical protein